VDINTNVPSFASRNEDALLKAERAFQANNSKAAQARRDWRSDDYKATKS